VPSRSIGGGWPPGRSSRGKWAADKRRPYIPNGVGGYERDRGSSE